MDSDEEIEELEKRRSQWDKGVTFTKRGIKDFINDMFENNDASKWESKINKPGVETCHMNRKGWELCKD